VESKPLNLVGAFFIGRSHTARLAFKYYRRLFERVALQLFQKVFWILVSPKRWIST